MGIVQQLLDSGFTLIADAFALPGFGPGFAAGLFGAVILAFAVFFLRWWWGGITEPLKPQSVTHTTSKTPAQILLSSCATFVVGAVVIVILFFVVLERLERETVRRLLASILQALGIPP